MDLLTLVRALLLGGVPDSSISLNATASRLITMLQPAAPRCHASRVIGFVGWQLPSGDILSGSAAIDRVIFEQPDFQSLPDAVRSHIISTASVLTASCESQDDPTSARRDMMPPKESAAPIMSQCRNTPIRGPDNATEVRYDPKHDDEGCFILMQGENNCYNYGTDVLTNTFAQPGRGSGVCPRTKRPCIPNTCDDVRKAAASDGLVFAGRKLPTKLPSIGHYVSLHIWPETNFHWLRQDANLTWSHKPGGSPVRNVDNDGNIITDPSKANVSPWSTHCGYLLATPSNVTLH